MQYTYLNTSGLKKGSLIHDESIFTVYLQGIYRKSNF